MFCLPVANAIWKEMSILSVILLTFKNGISGQLCRQVEYVIVQWIIQ